VATPAPDLDQFTLPPVTSKIGGTIAASGIQLHAKIAQGGTAADMTNRPAIVQVTANGAPLSGGSFFLPAGLGAHGRHGFVGENGQQRIEMRLVKRKPVIYKLTVRLPGPIAGVPQVDATIGLVYDVGGMLSRGTRTFRAKRAGSVLKAG